MTLRKEWIAVAVASSLLLAMGAACAPAVATLTPPPPPPTAEQVDAAEQTLNEAYNAYHSLASYFPPNISLNERFSRAANYKSYTDTLRRNYAKANVNALTVHCQTPQAQNVCYVDGQKVFVKSDSITFRDFKLTPVVKFFAHPANCPLGADDVVVSSLWKDDGVSKRAADHLCVGKVSLQPITSK